MAMAMPIIGIAQAGMGMMGQMQQQEAQNAAKYGQWLQQEHGKQLQADRENEKINRQMQKSIKVNSQIADYSLSQNIHNNQATTANIGQKEMQFNRAARQTRARDDASVDSRGLSTDSASAKAIKNAKMQDAFSTLASLDTALYNGLMQNNETRKGQLSQRSDDYYAPVNFSPSRAPTPTDNTAGILAGGLLNMAGSAFGSGMFGA